MKTCSVTFLPDNKTVEAAKGKSLLEAATAAGIPINNVCGGDGVCGKCRVAIKSGKVTAKPNMFLSRRDIQAGAALACQTYVDGDLVVDVPLTSRTGGVPQLATEDAIRFGKIHEYTGENARFRYAPLTLKVFLELPRPSADDPLPDQERLYRELRRRRDLWVMQAGLAVLRRLPGVLREADWKVTVLLGRRGGTVEIVDIEPGDTSAGNCGVALDIGTTTLVAHLVDVISTQTLATKAKYNSQSAYGDDVISRILYAGTESGLAKLREVLVEDINGLIAGLIQDAGVRLSQVTFVLASGNTTMTHLLFGLDPGNIRREPYTPCASMPPTIRAAEVGIMINGRGLLSSVPSAACYVGGDVVSDVVVSGMTNSTDISLLIDLGTNGELVLGNSEWLLCCSASAGPSFEGGGISCGMRAMRGAIEKIDLAEGGRIAACAVVGGGKPMGICGSGLIDAVGELLRVGCLDRAGRFNAETCAGRLRENEQGEQEFVLVPGTQTALGSDIVLTASDIRNLIHSKGSIYMGAECLLSHVGLAFNDVAHVYIAGGFGNYLRVEKAVAIGLLPDLPRERFEYIGNGSVQGAKMALLSEATLAYMLRRVAGTMMYIDLSASHKYMNEYSSCLFLPHTDLDRFPSVAATTLPPGLRSEKGPKQCRSESR